MFYVVCEALLSGFSGIPREVLGSWMGGRHTEIYVVRECGFEEIEIAAGVAMSQCESASLPYVLIPWASLLI